MTLARRGAAAVVCGLIAVTTVAPTAMAEPTGSGRVADAPTLAARDLGASPSLAFYGMQGLQSLTIPVPPGLRPAAVTADVELPVNLFIGSISVIQDDRTISRVDLPSVDRAPVSLPLTGAEVRDNALTVQIRTNLVPPQGYCAYDTTDPLQLVNVAVAFDGVERAPSAIADFLPPVLQRVTLFLPARPTMTESDAAVRMAAAVVAHYGAQPVRVDVVRLDGDAPLGQGQPLERQIVIRESGRRGMKLLGDDGVPSLEIAGSGEDLTNQIRLVTGSDVARLALTSSAIPGPLDARTVSAANSTTLRDLGQSGAVATSLTRPRVDIDVDQTRIGRPANRIRVNLKGSYTPLPQNLNGQIVVTANDEPVDRWAVEANGVIDRWVDVPDRLLSRNTELGVMIDATGTTGQCGESLPLTLTIDGDTTVTSEPADPPIPPGFQSIPQAFLPRLQVGITDDAFDDTARAVTIISGVQRLSAQPIDTAVVTLRDAIASQTPAVLIAADEWTDDSVTLPVQTERRAGRDAVVLEGTSEAGVRESVTLDPDLPIGSLQTVRTGDRTVLVATSNEAPAQLDSLLTWLNDDPRRWQRLSGAAVLSAPDREPFTVPAAPQAASTPSTQQDDSLDCWLVGAGVLIAAVAVGGLAWLRGRRTS
ncbi:hypothetical protein [Mycolicibacterium arenosum]|uniref:Cellulose synthase subunit n=1 Tax=Mycolicibacterium arenosum TaxID=2952157 RepID=A0ABT1MA10_9MYCO|nr:hypothetical protein [Mycolicibacterium sp. CAU 1645]MCP9275400.1 hypothetical protein [Mycolicibacterium sp. CAU 1645]